jgi:hypothetical protein
MNHHLKKRGRQHSVLTSCANLRNTFDDDDGEDSPCHNTLKRLRSMKIDNEVETVGVPWRQKRSRIDHAIDNLLRKQRKLIENNSRDVVLQNASVLPDPRSDLRLQQQLEVSDNNLILSRAFIPIDTLDEMQDTSDDRPKSNIVFDHSSRRPETRHAGDVSHSEWFIADSHGGDDSVAAMSVSDGNFSD